MWYNIGAARVAKVRVKSNRNKFNRLGAHAYDGISKHEF